MNRPMDRVHSLIQSVKKEVEAEEAGDDVAHIRAREAAWRLLLAVEVCVTTYP